MSSSSSNTSYQRKNLLDLLEKNHRWWMIRVKTDSDRETLKMYYESIKLNIEDVY